MEPIAKKSKIFRLVGLLPLAFIAFEYLKVLPPGITSLRITGWSDAPEFQVVGAYWGIAHSPGYPLYTLLSNIFVRGVGLFAPHSEPAWRVSLLSSVFGIATLISLYFLILQLDIDMLIASATVFSLGLSKTFWYYASIAEVYMLNNFLIVTGILLFLLWERNSTKCMYTKLMGLTFGAIVAHHRTGIFIVIAIAFCTILRQRRKPSILKCAFKNYIVYSIPLLLTYLYLPVVYVLVDRDFTHFYANAANPQVLLRMLSAKEWWQFVDTPKNLASAGERILSILLQQSSELGNLLLLGIGIVGLLFLPAVVSISLVLFVLFGVIYRVGDVSSMLTPVTTLLFLGVAVALDRLGKLLKKQFYSKVLFLYLPLVSTALFFITLSKIDARTRIVDHSNDTVGPDMVEAIKVISEDGIPVTIMGEVNNSLDIIQYAKARYHLTNVEQLSANMFQIWYRNNKTNNTDKVDQMVRDVFEKRWNAGKLVYYSVEIVDWGMAKELNQGLRDGRYVSGDTMFPWLKVLLPREGMPKIAKRPDIVVNKPLCDGLMLWGYDRRWIKKRAGIYLRLLLYFHRVRGVRGDDQHAKGDFILSIQPVGVLQSHLSSGQYRDKSLCPVPLMTLGTKRYVVSVFELRLNTLPEEKGNRELFLHLYATGQQSCQYSDYLPVPALPFK